MAVTTAHHHRHVIPTTIDMSTLSHSDLLSLSLLSSPHHPPSTTTITTNPASFNESASTRKQTFSSTPLRHPHHPHRHLVSPHEHAESISIVKFIKHRLATSKNSTERDGGGSDHGNGRVGIVNRNGVVVDLGLLEEVEDGGGGVYGEELRKRAAGREREDELLEVLGGMEGRWCSRRRKRRVVDACLLGDALPVGWKVIVALRRKDGRFSPYCRTYISPTGEQLSSCKEVSSYLKSHLGIDDIKLVTDSTSRDELQQLQTAESHHHGCANSKDGNSMLDVSASAMFNACISAQHEKDVSVLGIDDLPDVQIRDLYECDMCKISFDVKKDYSKHMLSSHESTTRRYRLGSSVGDDVVVRAGNDSKNILSRHERKKRRYKLGSSVGDGVIIRDGKYECQFCHKVFEERRRYLGHVGNHVKGSIKTTKDSPILVPGTAKSPCKGPLKTKIGSSKMDALIELAQSSIHDIAPSVPHKQPSSVHNVDQHNTVKSFKTMNAESKTEKNSSSCLDGEVKKHNGDGRTLSLRLNPCGKVNGALHACSNVTELVKDLGKDTTSSTELHYPLNKVSEISMVDGNINDSKPWPDEHQMEKNSGKAKRSSQKLYRCSKVRDTPMTDGTIYDSVSCLSEYAMEKVAQVSKSLVSEIAMVNRQTTEIASTGQVKHHEKSSCVDVAMVPAAGSGLPAKSSISNCECKSTPINDEGSADKPEEVFSAHCLISGDKSSDLNGSGENFQSKYVDSYEPGHVKEDDDGGSRASGFTEPQTSLNSSSPFDEIFEKAGHNICSFDQNLESLSELDYMKLDVIEPQMYKYNAMSGEDSALLSEMSMDLQKSNGFVLSGDASADSQAEFPQEMTATSLTSTLCVWCGVEFSHEIVDVEPQADSVGFMCPACRAKISKQFNELESNFSINPR